MKIDDQLEVMVRRILSAVVKADDAEYYAALNALSDDRTRAQAMKLAVTICTYTVYDAFDGKPTPEEVALTAEDVVAMARWMPLEVAEVNIFLNAILDGTPFVDVLDLATAFLLSFVVTGSLLGRSPKIGEGERWFNYLDQVEAAIEATPRE